MEGERQQNGGLVDGYRGLDGPEDREGHRDSVVGCATKEMAWRWIRQGCIISLVVQEGVSADRKR